MTSRDSGINNNPEASWHLKSKQLPMWVRRCGAWATEISLVLVSGTVPFWLGQLGNIGNKSVPLNPAVAKTKEVIANTFGIPLRNRYQKVTPLANLLWSTALLTPAVIISWQLFLLATTGQTLPKRWFEVRVVAALGNSPGWKKTLIREGLGKWGFPMGTAYLIWRMTGAFPSLGILFFLGGLTSCIDIYFVRFNKLGRTGHDKLGNTFVIDARSGQLDSNPFNLSDTNRKTSIATIVLSEKKSESFHLWSWMRKNPGVTWLIVTSVGIVSVLGTIFGTHVYIQNQANWREFKQQDNDMFLALINKLSLTSNEPQQRRVSVLALGSTQDPRAIPLLVDLLAQEKEPSILDGIQQSLVSAGPTVLPELRRLNQALKNDLESLSYGSNTKEQVLVSLRIRATQKAIAKILKVYSGSLSLRDINLSGVDLGQITSTPASFTLILENTDLSGIKLRSAILNQASFKNSRFYGPGKDNRIGTFDDSIADLSGANLIEVNLTGAVLGPVIMKRADLFRATLSKAIMPGSTITQANFSSAKLIETNLHQANLTEATFTGADLGSADLSKANLYRANLSKVKAEGTTFQLSDLRESNWQGANLSGANFSRANLKKADLSLALLTNANFRNAQLQNANLRNTDISLADLRGANLSGTDFKGAKFAAPKPNQTDQFLASPIDTFKSDHLRGVNFNSAKNLSPNQINYICKQGGIHEKCGGN
ncbi:pentapeptide repeat [Trichodesmium erythraeum IMS101]|uniref:Pentapeptide repeat n=1 Tax=Trichodesmium erythraeum (strain IMS101) TaxID=203124 RepID=Q10XB8_TRIEI|nr:pentapeptide repeat-containing protein [Trichodesmium erythraeum GBRTRLIN201]MDT9339300.1 pentapeptide repeat-containing protein [Trichodesmium erythraeum 21-75]